MGNVVNGTVATMKDRIMHKGSSIDSGEEGILVMQASFKFKILSFHSVKA